MKSCLIFCAAGCEVPPPEVAYDLVIAADGGLVHCQRWKIQPDIILGDFDSLGEVPAGAEVFPVEKDDTDAMLAVKRGIQEGCDQFYLCGSLDGPRLDHTVANFQTLAWLLDRGCQGWLLGDTQGVTLVKNSSLRFPAGTAGTVSIFSWGERAKGVTLKGLYYPLEQGSLANSFPLGVSNHFTGEPAQISVEEGTLMVIWDRKAGMPGK